MSSILHQPALILNKSWHPIDSTTVEEAICIVYAERARFLDHVSFIQYGMREWMTLPVGPAEKCLRTTHGNIRVPEIVLLSEYNHVPHRTVVFCRRNLWRRDKNRCQYCGKQPRQDEITIDHIVPRSKGGTSTFENCVLACMKCNLKKGNRSLHRTDMRLRKLLEYRDGKPIFEFYEKPHKPTWNPLYSLCRKTFPDSWKMFIKNIDEALYWEVELES